MPSSFLTHRKRGLILFVVSLIVIITSAIAVTFGSIAIPLEILLQIIATKFPDAQIARTWAQSWETILFDIRLPRVILAGLVGSALATSGATYQGLLRNPLADPYLIGVSAGAGLGATLAIVFSFAAIPLLAFIGALSATTLIYALARAGGRTTPTTLILAGVALGAFLSAITWFLTFSGNSTSYTHQVIAWMMGSFALASWQDVAGMLPYLGIGWLVLFLNARVLNVLQLGDTQAQQLGVPVERVTMILIAAASLITAAAVATSGIIGFVGLIVPHAVRLIWGPDHRFLLPMSALVGATFLIIADTFARTLLAPTELPVGIITSFCGAPFFLYLLRQKKETLI
jgi:iron complex transport system permease protein